MTGLILQLSVLSLHHYRQKMESHVSLVTPVLLGSVDSRLYKFCSSGDLPEQGKLKKNSPLDGSSRL